MSFSEDVLPIFYSACGMACAVLQIPQNYNFIFVLFILCILFDVLIFAVLGLPTFRVN